MINDGSYCPVLRLVLMLALNTTPEGRQLQYCFNTQYFFPDCHLK